MARPPNDKKNKPSLQQHPPSSRGELPAATGPPSREAFHGPFNGRTARESGAVEPWNITVRHSLFSLPAIRKGKYRFIVYSASKSSIWLGLNDI